ncbi:caspase family protein, partial [cf. Phormidesmis sp. LEGE 11477]|uniref:nSTAND1 domain-containing NTPase n=1 Tax=cf. Phormidesmis sp. LEGE 11477 TaxID=1828680 RepID=UPI001882319A
MARYALVVGVGEYDYLPDLSKPRRDAEAMRDVLQTGNRFEVTLLNEGVTRDRLRSALETLLLKRGKNSDVLIYFTGHGFTAGEDEDEAQGYLATQDCRVEMDGDRVLSARKGFSFQSLNGLIAKAELSSLVMLLDCCHGGSFIESAQAREKLSALNKTRYCLITACRSFEQAYAMTDAEHSIFSSAVLAALRTENGQVTALDVQRRVENELKNTGQEPLYVGAGSDVVILERRAVAAPTVSEECPYQGLRAFTPKTARFFKGREEETLLLRERLRQSNFVAVLGPSGSGKSSVVRAGLVTRLEAEGWLVLTMMPEDQPMANLKSAMKPLWEAMAVGEQRRLRAALQDEGILAMARQLPHEKESQRALLLVDQFEEVFTQCAEGKEDERDKFIQGLVALGQAQTPLAVVMTMRSDFVNEWLATGQPPEVMNHHAVYLGPLQGESLKAAIEEPARSQGYRFGDRLSALLLSDVKKEENCLPLLEFALTELWEKRDIEKQELTAAAYEKMAGLKGALNKRAEEVYENLREVDRPWAKRICLSLVRVGRGDK